MNYHFYSASKRVLGYHLNAVPGPEQRCDFYSFIFGWVKLIPISDNCPSEGVYLVERYGGDNV